MLCVRWWSNVMSGRRGGSGVVARTMPIAQNRAAKGSTVLQRLCPSIGMLFMYVWPLVSNGVATTYIVKGRQETIFRSYCRVICGESPAL